MNTMNHLTELLTRTARPRWTIAGRSFSPFAVCSIAGFIAGVGMAFALVAARALSPAVLAGCVAVALGVFYLRAMAVKIVFGTERYVQYHDELSILGGVALMLVAIGQPLVPYLAISALTMGVILAHGRIGCHSAGCCHGRASRIGVIYEDDGIAIPRAPVQLAESVWLLAAVAIGAIVFVRINPAAALAWYVPARAFGRFMLERHRGDARPEALGLSEAQWISLALVTVVAIGEARAVLPMTWTTLFFAAAVWTIAVATIASAIRTKDRLLSRGHLAEVARLAEALCGANTVAVLRTSAGLRISGGRVDKVRHFSLSRDEGALDGDVRERLGTAIRGALGDAGRGQWLDGNGGVVHLIVAME
jgi:prolipoprotein diacylglyceryltransferase